MMAELFPINVSTVVGQHVRCQLCCVKQKSTPPSSQTCLNSPYTLIDSKILFCHGILPIQSTCCICTFKLSNFTYFPTPSERVFLTKSLYNTSPLLSHDLSTMWCLSWQEDELMNVSAVSRCRSASSCWVYKCESDKVPLNFLYMLTCRKWTDGVKGSLSFVDSNTSDWFTLSSSGSDSVDHFLSEGTRAKSQFGVSMLATLLTRRWGTGWAGNGSLRCTVKIREGWRSIDV